MAGRSYSIPIVATAVTAAVDLWELTPADDKPIEIVGIFLGQSSDPGDAQAEQLPFTVVRGHTTSGSGGTAPTPTPLTGASAPQAAGFTAEVLNTTAASVGTTTTLHADVINLQAGYQLMLPEGFGWEASQANTTIVIRLGAAPADSITVSGVLYVKEYG